MNEDKKLRISEIRRGIFVIERKNEGKWYLLNSKGEFFMKAPEILIKNGFPPLEDRGEYKTLSEAEKAMKDFLFYPRVVKEADSELTETIDTLLPKLEQHVFEANGLLEKVIDAFKMQNGLQEEKKYYNIDNPI